MDVGRRSSNHLWLFCGSVAVVVGMWILYAYYGRTLAEQFGYNPSPDDAGKFGDSFGGLNALFTALAFCALVITVLMQRQDLELQREELRYTREELKGQREAMTAQNSTLERQNVDNRLFQMLQFHHAITEAIDIQTKDSSGEIARGRDSFRFFYNKLVRNYQRATENGGPNYGIGGPMLNRIQEALQANQFRALQAERRLPTDSAMEYAYLALFDEHQGDLGHYFRNLYHVFRMIDESDLTMREKRRFSNIARAQLSSYETALFFYNGVTPFGYQKFWPLIHDYGLLKNLDYSLLLAEAHRSFYVLTASLGSPQVFLDEGKDP
jgi:hypothetical protein